MTRKTDSTDGWSPFLIVAAIALLLVYVVSTLEMGQVEQAAGMAIIGIVVVVAYERYIGWG